MFRASAPPRPSRFVTSAVHRAVSVNNRQYVMGLWQENWMVEVRVDGCQGHMCAVNRTIDQGVRSNFFCKGNSDKLWPGIAGDFVNSTAPVAP